MSTGTPLARAAERLRARRRSAPMGLKLAGRAAARGLGRATAGLRMRPGFLIVGAQRAGTTALYRSLVEHPQVRPPLFHKGVHYFDVAYDRGPRWYGGHFPLRRPGHALTGEASPYYLHHPCAAERIAADLPGVRVVALLRDPVERAYSAHRHELERGFETEDFETALDLEPQRLAGEVERLRRDPSYRSFAHQHHAYVDRGHYAEQLQRYLDRVGRGRLLVLDSETWFSRPEEEYARLVDFLGLDPWRPARFEKVNARPRSPMAEATRRRLQEHFAPHDDALERLTGTVPGWRR